ncbi:oocyte zinc finger protein XlCOF28-like [Battus philenor]|uniref:oocyte zinc finger protein XlCOF28-like n=1 Tax=Battus philenor TaxID=42288 RepID=UPI0035CFA84C
MEDIMQDGPIFVDVMGNESEFVEMQTSGEQAEGTDREDTNDQTKQCSESSDSYLKIQKRRIRCPECKRYTAENEEKMQRHIRKVHRGENPFQCSMCDYSTYNKSMFEEHVRIHQGIKPFKCSKCPYRSVSKKNTKKHELIHRPNNPLKCTHCDFIARHSRSLLNHLRQHGIEKDNSVVKIKCVKCDKSYPVADFEVHKKIKEECKRCSFISCSKSGLMQHMSKVHGEGKKKRMLETLFVCSICSWSSRSRPRILLHLIHHPNQYINEKELDVTVLKKHGILN